MLELICAAPGVVLAIEFPPTIKQMFDKLSVLALNIKSILQINCFGDLTFCETPCVCKAKPKLTLGCCAQTKSGWCVSSPSRC